MKTPHLIISALALAATLSANAQLSVSYPKIERSETDRLVLQVEDVEQLKIKVTGKPNASSMSIDINFVDHDSINTVQLIPVLPITSDTIPDIIITTKSLGDSIKLIYSSRIITGRIYPKPDVNAILMETFTTDSNSTTLPLFAITPGIKKRVNIAGKEMDGVDYCGLRYSNVPPELWYKTFDIKEYIYFTLNLHP